MSVLPEKDLPPGRHRLLKEHLMTEIRQETQAIESRPRRSPWLRPVLIGAAGRRRAGGGVVGRARGGAVGGGAHPGRGAPPRQCGDDVDGHR
ncbi:hypothetical protein ACFV0R_31340 [Streptomyces sp. NPDC059578]|uniref:hypothetical protein n=1 Tax=Streptomyces sp. NPDC059578 TaxID=3346874 RepID=UPI003688AFC2